MTLLRAVGILIVMAVAFVLITAIAADACDGFMTPTDGCVDADTYDAWFSVESLEQVESLSFRGRSVASVYEYQLGDGSGPPLRPSDRPREFMGEVLPTVREILERLEECADNPGLCRD